MKDRKIIKKFNWILNLDIENLLACFSDMARKGYHFKEYKHFYTVFEKGSPKEVNYICAYINRHDEEAIAIHKVEFGWEYVSPKDEFHYYKRESNNELYNINDGSMFIHNIDEWGKIKKRNTIYLRISDFIAIVMIIFIVVFASTRMSKTILLENQLLGSVVLFFSGIASNVQTTISSYRLGKVCDFTLS